MTFASEGASTLDTELDLDLLQLLGETEGLESLGADIDDLLGVDESVSLKRAQEGVNYEN